MNALQINKSIQGCSSCNSPSITNNFEKLISLLYRVDVSERKLKQMLNENKNSDAGKIIAELIIERQLQKIKTRNEFKKRDDVSDEEKW